MRSASSGPAATATSSRPARSVRRVLGGLVVLALAAVLAACGAATQGAPAAAPSSAAPATAAPGMVVMVIRHGEKPDGGPGVDADGKKDDSSLTAVGWQRANLLADLFDPASGQPRPGLVRPAAIYAAGANDDGEGKRPRETVAPLAQRLGITENNDFGKGDEQELVGDVIARGVPALICWQHGELPDIAAAFPDVTPKPPKDWPNDRFDVIWIFTRTADGWHFTQQPQLLLPDDQDTVIK